MTAAFAETPEHCTASGEDRLVFDCRRCGSCCSGAGGIVVSAGEVRRIAVFLKKDMGGVPGRWLERRNGKLCVTTGSDGACVFFSRGDGCRVHPVKPAICRAWPFFRGNLVDAVSLDLARGYCPGISRDVSHEQFCRAGYAYLQAEGLATDKPGTAAALNVFDVAAPGPTR